MPSPRASIFPLLPFTMFGNQQLPLSFIDSDLKTQQYDVEKETWMQSTELARSYKYRYLLNDLNHQLRQLAPVVDGVTCCECGNEDCEDRSNYAVFTQCVGAAVMEL